MQIIRSKSLQIVLVSRVQHTNIIHSFKISISQREIDLLKILIFIYNKLAHRRRLRELFTQEK